MVQHQEQSIWVVFGAAPKFLKGSLVSLVPGVLRCCNFSLEVLQSANKNCCHLAALQPEAWSGRWKTSFCVARLALGVTGACQKWEIVRRPISGA